MTSDLAGPVSAWLITFALHSSVLMGLGFSLAWECRRRQAFSREEVVWRAFPLGALATATLQPLLPEAWRRGGPVLSPVIVQLPPGLEGLGAQAGDPPGGPWPALLVLLAASAAALRVLSWGARRLRLGLFLRERQPAPESLNALLGVLVKTAGVRARPRLSVHSGLRSPVAFGVWDPEIALPARALREGPGPLRAMLAHELAHLQGRDPLWRSLFDLLEALFPWQPLFRLARRRAEAISELRCDSHAARWAGAEFAARSLVTAAGWINPRGGGPEPQMAGLVRSGLLEERVDRLLGAPRPWNGPGRGFVLGVLVALGFLAPVLPGAVASGQGEASPPLLPASAWELGAGSGPAAMRVQDSEPSAPCGSLAVSHGSPKHCAGGARHGRRV